MPISTLKPRGKSKYAMLLALPLLIGSLAACSTGDDSSSKDGASSEQTLDDWQVDFASCMREQGVDVPDPKSGESLTIDQSQAAAFEEASKTCEDKIGPPPGGTQEISPAEQAKLHEGDLETASCLRERGYEIADPKPDEKLSLPTDIALDDVEACFDTSLGATSAG